VSVHYPLTSGPDAEVGLRCQAGQPFLRDRPGGIGQEYPHVHEGYNAFLVGLFFILLMSSWIIANAVVDLAAKRVRIWVASRWIDADRRRAASGDRESPRIS
jgi:hypothetical protein